jgi:hypothetical protein
MLRSTLIKVFLAALLVRVVYATAVPSIYYFNADTMGYYSLGAAMFANPSVHTIITPYRTPLYPLFFNAVMYISGAGGTAFGSPAFAWGTQIIVAIQMMIGALAFTAFYHALSAFLSRRARFLFGVFLLFDVFVIGWERTLLTEGLAVSVSLFITAVLIHILAAPTVKKFAIFLFLFAFGFLLRPSFIVLPLAALPIVAWYFRKHGRVVFLACVTLAAALAIPLAYARINEKQHGYFGVQYVSDIDVVGRILGFNIPVESAKNNTYFYSTMKDSRTKNPHPLTGFQFLEEYDPAIWGKAFRFTELQQFNRTVILNNLPLYVSKAISTIPEILLEVCIFSLVPAGSINLLTRIVRVLQQGYGTAQYATLAIPLLWMLTGIIFLIKPTRWNAAVTLIGTLAMSQILLTALVVYKDVGGQYGRVLSVVQPHMFLFLFLCAVAPLGTYRKKIHKI